MTTPIPQYTTSPIPTAANHNTYIAYLVIDIAYLVIEMLLYECGIFVDH